MARVATRRVSLRDMIGDLQDSLADDFQTIPLYGRLARADISQIGHPSR